MSVGILFTCLIGARGSIPKFEILAYLGLRLAPPACLFECISIPCVWESPSSAKVSICTIPSRCESPLDPRSNHPIGSIYIHKVRPGYLLQHLNAPKVPNVPVPSQAARANSSERPNQAQVRSALSRARSSFRAITKPRMYIFSTRIL